MLVSRETRWDQPVVILQTMDRDRIAAAIGMLTDQASLADFPHSYLKDWAENHFHGVQAIPRPAARRFVSAARLREWNSVAGETQPSATALSVFVTF